MRVIQSFWNAKSDRLSTGGFSSIQHHLYSWALSSLTISKFHSDLNLITDNLGKHILIDTLQLPYRNYSIEFEGYKPIVANEPWTLKKMLAFALQDQSFIHIDGDVYLWKPLPQRILDAELIAQNLDVDLLFYRKAYEGIGYNFNHIPKQLQGLSEIYGANAGIIGGKNYNFFKELHCFARRIIEDNEKALDQINSDYLSTFLEQSLYYYLSKDSNIDIEFLLNFIVLDGEDPPLQQFSHLPDNCDYIHLMLSKSNPLICNQLQQRLYIDFKDYYELINNYLSSIDHYTVANSDKQVTSELPRTKAVCNHLLSQHPKSDSFVWNESNFISCVRNVKSILSEVEQGILNDVYRFEIAKHKADSEENRLDLLKQAVEINQMLLSEKIKLKDGRIGISTLIRLVESEWSWASETGTLNEERIQTIVNQRPSYFLTAIIPLNLENSFFEYQFDVSGVLLLESIAQPCALREVLTSLRQTLRDEDGDLENRFVNYIRFFLYLGILEYKHG